MFRQQRRLIKAIFSLITSSSTTRRGASSFSTFGILMMTNAYNYDNNPTKRFPYTPPTWTKNILQNVPSNGRIHLANLPTPLYKLSSNYRYDNEDNDDGDNSNDSEKRLSILKRFEELDINLFIKRDDMSGGVEIGGNKIRKLEFLLADALAKGYTDVVTIGGEQSNHCRATAAACRMVGLKPHLILRTKRAVAAAINDNDDSNDADNNDLGFVGNILFDRMVGSTLYTCTPGEYGRIGSNQLVQRLCAYLESKNDDRKKKQKKVYPIPVGGSNGLGTWGYIEGSLELQEQWKSLVDNNKNSIQYNNDNKYDSGNSSISNLSPSSSLDHIVFACGSGGTATGIALGTILSHVINNNNDDEIISNINVPKIHAIGVCDDPDYFYKYTSKIAQEMGFSVPTGIEPPTNATPSSIESIEKFIRQYVIVHQGKGLGYAISTEEELNFVTQFALETGIVLDPVYTGKALYYFFKSQFLENDANSNGITDAYRNKNILFWHTGGALGLYDKGSILSPTLSKVAPTKRLNVYNTDQKEGTINV